MKLTVLELMDIINCLPGFHEYPTEKVVRIPVLDMSCEHTPEDELDYITFYKDYDKGEWCLLLNQ